MRYMQRFINFAYIFLVVAFALGYSLILITAIAERLHSAAYEESMGMWEMSKEPILSLFSSIY